MSAREARVHATICAVILWVTACAIVVIGSGARSFAGPLKGGDFIFFYTLGHIDRNSAPTILYNPEALHELQTRLLPESEAEQYLPVYPPLAVLLFTPFAAFSYGTAALLWAAVLATGYAACVWTAWRPYRQVLRDRHLITAAAAAFPPFWYLVLNGQATIVPLLAFFLGWMALERQKRFWAGAAFGLLLLKPQFALVLVPLVLVCREWAILAGAASSIAVQVALTVSVLGPAVLWDYAAVVGRFPEIRVLLEPRPEQMHSIATMTSRLPGMWGGGAWALLSAFIVIRTIQLWRSTAPVAVRVAVVVIAALLVNPHVFVYDVTVLALPLVWIAAWVYGHPDASRDTRAIFALVVYGLYLSLLAPTGALLPVQLSVVLIGGLFILVSRLQEQVRQTSSPDQSFCGC